MNDFKQIFPLGEKMMRTHNYFTGQSYISVLILEGIPSFNVTFEPGYRTNWHVHHKGGQILYCTAGKGWYQEEVKPPETLTELASGPYSSKVSILPGETSGETITDARGGAGGWA